MLDAASIDTAVQRLADGFLTEVRTARMEGPGLSGWGQFLNIPTTDQVGLYGTCSGMIVVSLAYGGARVPPNVVAFLAHRWNSRSNFGTKSPRDFALTLRLAYFYLALRISNIPTLGPMLGEVEAELQARQIGGLWQDWRIDAHSGSHTASEYTAAFVILAHTLPVMCAGGAIPDQVPNAAERLQTRLQASEPRDAIGARVILAAIGSALPPSKVTRHTRALVHAELRRDNVHQQHLLRFFDHKYRDAIGEASRRDYSVIPYAGLEIILASTDASSFVGKVAGFQRADWVLSRISHAQPAFFTGSSDAIPASVDQAWVAIALVAGLRLLKSDKAFARVVLSIQRNDFVWDLVAALVLLLAGGATVVPTYLAVSSQTPTQSAGSSWDYLVLLAIVLGGSIVLAAWGQSLGHRAIRLIRRLLP
jgi:hypothetical protein